MAWSMQTIGLLEIGDMKKANDYLHKQLAFIKNSFQVYRLFTHFHGCPVTQCCLRVSWHCAVCVCHGTVLFTLSSYLHLVGGAVAQWLERWTCEQQVVGSNPTQGKAA